MADEGQVSVQVLELHEGPSIIVEEVGEAHAFTPHTAINNLRSPFFYAGHLFSSHVPPTPPSPPFYVQ